jgi:hypothetical protein
MRIACKLIAGRPAGGSWLVCSGQSGRRRRARRSGRLRAALFYGQAGKLLRAGPPETDRTARLVLVPVCWPARLVATIITSRRPEERTPAIALRLPQTNSIRGARSSPALSLALALSRFQLAAQFQKMSAGRASHFVVSRLVVPRQRHGRRIWRRTRVRAPIPRRDLY